MGRNSMKVVKYKAIIVSIRKVNWRNVEEIANNIISPNDHGDPELGTNLYGLFLIFRANSLCM